MADDFPLCILDDTFREGRASGLEVAGVRVRAGISVELADA